MLKTVYVYAYHVNREDLWDSEGLRYIISAASQNLCEKMGRW